MCNSGVHFIFILQQNCKHVLSVESYLLPVELISYKISPNRQCQAVRLFGSEVTPSQQTTFDVQNSHMTPRLRAKIAYFSLLHCLAIPWRDLSTKSTKPNREKWSKRIGVMLELVYYVKNCPRWCLPLPFVCLPFTNMHVVESMTSPVVIT